MDMTDLDNNMGPGDMNSKIEADVKIELESDAEEEDGENPINATRTKSVKQNLVKSGLWIVLLVYDLGI